MQNLRWVPGETTEEAALEKLNLVTLQEFAKRPDASLPAHWHVENQPHQTGIQITQGCQGAADMPRWMGCLFAMKTQLGIGKTPEGKFSLLQPRCSQTRETEKSFKNSPSSIQTAVLPPKEMLRGAPVRENCKNGVFFFFFRFPLLGHVAEPSSNCSRMDFDSAAVLFSQLPSNWGDLTTFPHVFRRVPSATRCPPDVGSESHWPVSLEE